MARRGGGRAARGGGRGARSRRDDYDEEDEYDDRPRGGARRGNQGPNMTLILGSLGGLVAMIVIGGVVMMQVSKSREAEKQAYIAKIKRQKQEREDKIAAQEEANRKRAEEKLKREGPWKKALEPIMKGLKRWMNKQNEVKRIIGTYGFENDRATYNFKVRPKWFKVDKDECEATMQKLIDKVVALTEEGFAHAEKEGYPMENKAIEIRFYDPPEDPDDKGRGKKVATYKNGSLSITGR